MNTTEVAGGPGTTAHTSHSRWLRAAATRQNNHQENGASPPKWGGYGAPPIQDSFIAQGNEIAQ
jgi:hypothetical protein